MRYSIYPFSFKDLSLILFIVPTQTLSYHLLSYRHLTNQMDDRFDDPWASDIVESYFDLSSEKRSTPLSLPTDSSNGTNYTYNSKYAMKQRRSSSQQSASQMLSAPSLEKTDSQYSPMSSGLITPLDSIWTISPDRRRSGRFSGDSSGVFGQSNRWSLGTQLSNVSFTECIFPC